MFDGGLAKESLGGMLRFLTRALHSSSCFRSNLFSVVALLKTSDFITDDYQYEL